jgi:uncharacterized membrane protein SpoIIM required for sporulation
MKQQDFEARFATRWEQLTGWLESAPGPARKAAATGLDAAEVPARYREVCQHLALAQDRQYSAELIERLSRLALAGHQRLYGAQGALLAPLGRFVLSGFPQAVRAQLRYVLLALLLFFGPLLLLTGALQRYPEFAYVVLPAEYVDGFEEMYGEESQALGRKRDADDDAVMFGFYIWNNVRIGFQTFAGGILFGVGTVFYLLYNGLVIGTVTGYLMQAGLGTNFFSFTSGHSAFELTAIVLCGAAGLRIGYALIAPGRRRRVDALRAAAHAAMPLVIGSAGMLVLAAGIEAFWSPRTELPLQIKYAFGLGLWLLTLTYFGMMGRRGAA